MIQQNFLAPNAFQLVIDRLPNVEFFVQGCVLPGLNMGVTQSPTPFKTLRYAGDKLEHDPLIVTLRLDEEMKSYTEIYNWMVGLTKNETYDQFKNLKASDAGLYSDATLMILNSRKNPAIEVHFKDIFPTAISGVSFDLTNPDIIYPTVEITFEHNGHYVKNI